MRVFVTGASGWIGSAVVAELLEAGHTVAGLARNDESATRIQAAGAEAHRGSLDDLDSIRSGAEQSDGVIHLGFKHDFSDMAGAARTERAVVTTLTSALEGSDRPLLLASGVAGLQPVTPGGLTTEDIRPGDLGPDAPRGSSEGFVLGFADRGIRSISARFAPTVHGEGDHGFIAQIARVAKEKGVSGYVADGSNRWPAVHRSDAARAVRLGFENAPADTVLHVVAEEGVATRAIAEAIAGELGIPTRSIPADEAADHFGWIGMFFAMDLPASSTRTQQLLGWTPTHPTLLDDLAAGYYTK